MRGFFGVGAERISKPMNVGSIFRSAHAFGASFVFTVAANYGPKEVALSDTSGTADHLPFYAFPSLADLVLPQACSMVGIELTDQSIDLPSFRHPANAAYVLGPERGSLSPAFTERCDFVVKIPTKFCVNVGIAAAVVLYDRHLQLGRYPPKPLRPGGPTEALPDHVHGGQKFRVQPLGAQPFRAPPPETTGYAEDDDTD